MIIKNNKPYREFRCTKCRSLLALEYIYSGRFSIKCHVCNVINDIECSSTKRLLLDQTIKPMSFDSELKGGELNNG